MDEPCDWDVCTEVSTPGPQSQLFKTEKKRRAKADTPAIAASVRDQPVKHSVQRKPEKTHPAVRLGAHGEGNPRKASPAKEALPLPTRKELQDALPKISPLSSFKSHTSGFMSLEEADRDFHTFITTGLGRSVEVIREFRGGEDDGDQNRHSVSVMLEDDGTQSVSQNCRWWQSELSPPKSTTSSSKSDEEESLQDDERLGQLDTTRGGEYSAVTKTEASHRFTVVKPKAKPIKTEPKVYHQTIGLTSGRALSPRENYESVSTKSSRQTAPAQTNKNESRKMKEEIGKRSRRVSEKMSKEQKRERDEGEHDEGEEEEEEEEWSAETYWRDCYRAWTHYYASMSPFQEQGYQSYYSVAHNWMAAYRMNAVYMEELLKY